MLINLAFLGQMATYFECKEEKIVKDRRKKAIFVSDFAPRGVYFYWGLDWSVEKGKGKKREGNRRKETSKNVKQTKPKQKRISK